MPADRFTIAPACAGDAEAVLALYRAAARTPGSSWDDSYPDRDLVTGDIARGSLYCLWGKDGTLWGAGRGYPGSPLLGTQRHISL